jgi:signal transduction histidine kinase
MMDRLTTPSVQYINETERHEAQILAGIALTGIVITTTSQSLRLFCPEVLPYPMTSRILAFGFSPWAGSVFVYYLVRTHNTKWAGTLLLLGIYVGFLGQALFSGTQAVRSTMAFVYLIPLVSSFMGGVEGTIFWTLMTWVGSIATFKTVPGLTSQEFVVQTISLSASALVGAVSSHLRRKGEKEVNLKRAQLSDASKFTALGEVSAGVAHEINNPLAVIQLKSEQIRHQLIDIGKADSELHAKELADQVDIIEKMNERISRIIYSLNVYSRNGSQDSFEPVRVEDLIESSNIICGEKMSRFGVRFTVTGLASDPFVKCRESQIVQVLVHLLSNSIDAVQKLQDKWIKIDIGSVAEWVEISVMDSGNGIPTDVLERVFDPFFTTKDIGKGIGLGLSASQGMVQSHQGTLTVDRNSPHTRFLLRLPRCNPPESGSRSSI